VRALSLCASSHDFDPSKAKKISSNNRLQERATRVKTKQNKRQKKIKTRSAADDDDG
jgi:hypothetical protein